MPTTFEALLVLILFVLPGFILMRVITKARPHSETSDFRFIVSAILFGTIVHAIFGWWTIDVYLSYTAETLSEDGFWSFYLWFVGVILVAPTIFGFVLGKLAEVAWIDNLLVMFGLSVSDRMPTAWDEVFGSGKGYWIIVELNDGRKLGGFYSTNSFVSASPNPRDIYIEQVWEVGEDDNFLYQIEPDEGIWIEGAQIRLLKFFK